MVAGHRKFAGQADELWPKNVINRVLNNRMFERAEGDEHIFGIRPTLREQYRSIDLEPLEQ